jgi:hypothetical protein
VQRYDYPLYSVDPGGAWIDLTMPRVVLATDSPFKPNVVTTVAPLSAPDLAAHVAAAKEELEASRAFQKLAFDDDTELRIDGDTARVVRFAYDLVQKAGKRAKKTERLRVAQLHVVRRGFVFTFTFTAQANEFDEHYPRFVALAESVRFRA